VGADVNKYVTDESVEKENVWNSDQSQFNYEMSPLSTLDHRGEKTADGVL